MKILGPEFHRNLWIRFSWFSILAAPILIGLAIVAAYLANVADDALVSHTKRYMPLYSQDQDWSTSLIAPSLFCFFLLMFVLGTYEASSAFTNELKNKTWDLQKMSAIRPWSLMIGKLLGTTSYAWYFGLCILVVFLWAYSNYFVDETHWNFNRRGAWGPVKPLFVYPTMQELFYLSLCLIVSAFAGHIVALYGSLQSLKKQTTNTFGAFVAGLITTIFVAQLFFVKFSHSEMWRKGSVQEDVYWFDFQVNAIDFLLYSLLFFMFWGVVALWRNTRTELRFRNFPFYWLAFLLSVCVYIAGVFNRNLNDAPYLELGACLLMMMGITYASFYQESSNLSLYQRLFGSIRIRNMRRCLEDVPLWFIPGILACGIILYFVVQLYVFGAEKLGTASIVFLLFVFLLVVRDGIVFHIFLLGDRIKHGMFKLIVFFIMMYCLLPMIVFQSMDLRSAIRHRKFLSSSGSSNIEGDLAWSFFFPSFWNLNYVQLLPVLFEVILAAVVLWFVTKPYRHGKADEVVVAAKNAA